MEFENSQIEFKYNPLGEIESYIVRSDKGSISSIQNCDSNGHCIEIKKYIEENSIQPYYDIKWVQKILNGNGDFLFYRTNIGDFPNSDEILISKEIKIKLERKELEIRESEIEFQIKDLKINIFLPRKFQLTDTNLKSIKSYDLEKKLSWIINKKNRDYTLNLKLLQSIENEFFKNNQLIRENLRYIDGLIIRFTIDKKNIKNIYDYSKNYFDKGLLSNHKRLQDIDFVHQNRKKNRGVRTGWYFDYFNLQSYISILILEITNEIIYLINQQAHRKTLPFVSEDEIKEMVCIKAKDMDDNEYLWNLGKLQDEQINIFPHELNFDYQPFSIATNKIRFLFDQGLYFEAIVVTQTFFEFIFKDMFYEKIKKNVFKKENLKWEDEQKYLFEFFKNKLTGGSYIKFLLQNGLREIYEYRNDFAHGDFFRKPEIEYKYNLKKKVDIEKLLKIFIDTWENYQFGLEIHSMYLQRNNFNNFLLTKGEIMEYKKENLLIIISTDNVETILKFPLLYGGVSIPRDYWKRVHIMFWGASIKVASTNKQVQEKVQLIQKDGVEFSSCIVCAEEYGVVEELTAIGIECNHTGELLNEALQNDKIWATLTV